jgi:hypothetical protein
LVVKNAIATAVHYDQYCTGNALSLLSALSTLSDFVTQKHCRRARKLDEGTDNLLIWWINKHYTKQLQRYLLANTSVL